MKKTELVLHNDGSIYHLKLKPGDVAETIFLVGDPARSKIIASFFDEIIFSESNREINTYTGFYKGKKLSVMSTGMGTDNIEIVISELDALFNIDFKTRMAKDELTSLNLIRVGTSGALQSDVPVKYSYMASAYALGLDGLAYFYEQGPFVMERELTSSFINQMDWDIDLPKPYGVLASAKLLKTFAGDWRKGITLTAPGFYAPQGRELRLKVSDNTIIERASKFKYNGFGVTNFEMETSALYLLAGMLGHQALTVCDIIANRVTGEFNQDHASSMERLIKDVLDKALTI